MRTCSRATAGGEQQQQRLPDRLVLLAVADVVTPCVLLGEGRRVKTAAAAAAAAAIVIFVR